MTIHPESITIETRRGIPVRLRIYRSEKATQTPMVYFHGAVGLLPDEPTLAALAEHRTVVAPVWPGYGDEPGEEKIEDMLDFTLHGWDIVEALRAQMILPSNPHPVTLAGNCMGAMIAAEMACVAPGLVERLVLVDPLGVWIDSHPIPDLFATMPFEFPGLLFHDAELGTANLIGGTDWNDPKAIETFLISNARRLGTAGKILFPVPNRRLAKRLYRITCPTLAVWGDHDKLVPADPYARRWKELIAHAETTIIENAGHLPTIEQPAATTIAINTFLTA